MKSNDEIMAAVVEAEEACLHLRRDAPLSERTAVEQARCAAWADVHTCAPGFIFHCQWVVNFIREALRGR